MAGPEVRIRDYQAADHAMVRDLFLRGMLENWWPAYRWPGGL
jgi:hypothetical protein